MRKTLLVLVVMSVIILSFSIAHSQTDYTYDSIIDPAEFQDWDIVKKTRTGINEGMAVLKNPDKTAAINAVIVLMRNRWLMSYTYILDGKQYKYEYDFDTKHFGLVLMKTVGRRL